MEIFFDLFFAANYSVFSENQEVTNHARFKAYVGYFWYALPLWPSIADAADIFARLLLTFPSLSLLWLTWFLVTLYDVRFVTDSIFGEAFHLKTSGCP